jgi:undecaprenyl-diphosphatase
MDIDILLAIQDIRVPFLDGVFTVFRYLGEPIVPIIIFAIVWWFGYRKQGFIIFLSFYFSIIINFILKVIFCIPRPFLRDTGVVPVGSALDTATGYSFPSTHTAVAAAYLGPLGMAHRKKIVFPIIAGLVCCLVGFSRIYMGVHTPQDILVSLVLGFLIVLMVFKIAEWLIDRADAELILAAVAFAGFVLLLLITIFRHFPEVYTVFYAPDLYVNYPMNETSIAMQRDLMTMGGALFGFSLGFLCDHLFVHYEVSDSRVFNIVTSVIGLALTFLIKTLTQPFFEGIGYVYGHALLQAVIIFFIVALWPMIIRFLQKKFLRY